MGGWRCRRYTGGRLGKEFGFKVKGMIRRHLEGAWGSRGSFGWGILKTCGRKSLVGMLKTQEGEGRMSV